MKKRSQFGRVAADYAAHRAGFPDSFFDRLQALGVGLRGQALVDLATGTGVLARSFALRGCGVIGIDVAPEMLEQARRLDAEAGIAVDYRQGRAEATGLPSASADAVTAGSCWSWFDRSAAVREVARVLRDTGFLVIAQFDWIAVPGSVAAATEEVILACNRRWSRAGGTGLHPRWLGDLDRAGYRAKETFSYDVEVKYTPEAWHARIRSSGPVGAVLSERKREAFDREHAAMLRRRFPVGELSILHRVFAIVARPPTAG